MRRLLLCGVVGALLLTAAGPAWAHGEAATQITVTSDTITVNGKQVNVPVRVTDADGRPVARALLRLTVPVEFMGAEKSEIVAEATTSDSGRAVLQFAPSASGTVEGSVVFWGAHGYAPSEASITFDVRQPVYTYTWEPVGLQAWWARSYLILVPFAVVWFTYLLVVTLVVRLRRAGISIDPSGSAASS
jgi:hypothetical protein